MCKAIASIHGRIEKGSSKRTFPSFDNINKLQKTAADEMGLSIEERRIDRKEQASALQADGNEC